MKITIKNSLALALLTAAVAMSGLTACSSSEDSIAEETPIVNPTAQTYRVSIPATMGDGATRAVTFGGTDANPTSNSTFATTEKVYVYNVTKDEVLSGYLTPTNLSDNGKSCDLTGTLTGTLSPNDNIQLLYNLSNVETDKNIYKNDTKFDYSNQNGTAAGVLDGAIATATLDSYTSGGALTTTATASFTNVQSMFRFKFIDENNHAINVKSLTIHSEINALVHMYCPLYEDNPYYRDADITVTLASATTDYIYAALCFYGSDANDALIFTATDNDGNKYLGSKSAPNDGFENRKYYWNSSAIQLYKQPNITWTSVLDDKEVVPDKFNCYTIKGPENDISGSDPAEIAISGACAGCYFFMDNSATINLNGLTATYDGDVMPFIASDDGDLNLVVNGTNSITCKNYDQCIFVLGNLKLSGNGTLTVTAKSDDRYGLYAESNYSDDSNSDASALAATGYTVTRSDVTNGPDEDNDEIPDYYTWTYTVAPVQ